MELRPLRGRIYIGMISEHKQTESGLYLADSIKDIPKRGEVLAIGLPYMNDKGKEFPWHLKVGEIVHFKRQWETVVKHSIIKRDDVIAVENESGIRAIGDNVMIKRHFTGKIGASTIIIPNLAETKSNTEDYYGEVVSEGSDSTFNFKKGDKIIYHRNEGSAVKFKGEEFFVLKPRAVLARTE